MRLDKDLREFLEIDKHVDQAEFHLNEAKCVVEETEIDYGVKSIEYL